MEGAHDQIQAEARPAASEWLAVASAAVFLISLFALSWFGYSLEGDVVPGSTGDAFRWLHGLDVVLLLTGLVALGAASLTLIAPTRPEGLLAGVIAGTVATFLTIGLMISPPEGGEAIFGATTGSPAGEIVPQRGALVGLFAALGIGIANWLGLSRLMEQVAAERNLHAPSLAPPAAPVQPPSAASVPEHPVPVAEPRAPASRSRQKPKPKPKPKPKAPAGTSSKAKPARKRATATKKAAATSTKRRATTAAKPKAGAPNKRPTASASKSTRAKSSTTKSTRARSSTAKPAPKSSTAKRKTTTRKRPKPG